MSSSEKISIHNASLNSGSLAQMAGRKCAGWPSIPAAAWKRDFHASDVCEQQTKVPNIFDTGNLHGCPLGGIGAGGIGRDWQGSFRRWTLKTGSLKHFVEPVNNFAVRQKPAGGKASARALQPKYPNEAPENGPCRNWFPDDVPLEGTYHALFPKAWYHYHATEQLPVEMVCEQFSPIQPHNYQETSYPVGVFRWTLRNTADVPVETSLMFSFANMNGWFRDYGNGRPLQRSSGNMNRPFDSGLSLSGANGAEAGQSAAVGVIMDHERFSSQLREGRGQFAIAAESTPRCSVSRRTTFDILQDSDALWQEFSETGALTDSSSDWVAAGEFPARQSGHIAGAVCVTVTLEAGETLEIPFSLAWDLPVVEFGMGREYYRRYTRFYGTSGANAARMACDALENYAHWSSSIASWHEDVMAKQRYGGWYYTMLFNELYLAVDGYTVWTDKAVNGGPDTPDECFGIIECPDYPYYNTLDLWVYGSFAILANWPEVERHVITAYAKQAIADDPAPRRHLQSDRTFPRTLFGQLPHDLGAPDEDPFNRVNSYNYQDSNIWKDLNAQFVVTVYRDYLFLKDESLLEECWAGVAACMERMETYDRDGDGLIENDNEPDQTFDMIPMSGPSAYCGGLWMASLAASAAIADILGHNEQAEHWRKLLEKAAPAFEEALWNGECYRIDQYSDWRDNVFAEQLFGIWYADALKLGQLVDRERAVKALSTVYRENFMANNNGASGVMNLAGVAERAADGAEVGNFVGQGDESLVGINFSVANQFAHYGLKHEAESVLKTMYNLLYHEREMWFRTPAALTVNKPLFRAILNLRPLMVWSQEAMDGLE